MMQHQLLTAIFLVFIHASSCANLFVVPSVKQLASFIAQYPCSTNIQVMQEHQYNEGSLSVEELRKELEARERSCYKTQLIYG